MTNSASAPSIYALNNVTHRNAKIINTTHHFIVAGVSLTEMAGNPEKAGTIDAEVSHPRGYHDCKGPDMTPAFLKSHF